MASCWRSEERRVGKEGGYRWPPRAAVRRMNGDEQHPIDEVWWFFFSSRRRHTRFSRDWSSDVCSSDLAAVNWHALVEQAISDVLPLAERRRIELGCDWPGGGAPAFPLHGDGELLAVLLRNLLDHAVRYAPEGSTVTLRFDGGGLAIENDGPPLPAATLARLGA